MSGIRKALEAQQRAVHEKGVKVLAAELDKAPSTLYDELSLSPGSKAKLGAEDFFRLMELTEDHEPLHILAAHFGYRLAGPSREPDGVDMDEECLQGILAVARFIQGAKNVPHHTELSAFLKEAVQELEDVFVRRKMEDIERELGRKNG